MSYTNETIAEPEQSDTQDETHKWNYEETFLMENNNF